ncbi:MAG: hypothetical protein FWF57_09400 [Defluviitaleaceae bacterium]|nr:hypothetical protein [Defluviitaleaceae bacterium]
MNNSKNYCDIRITKSNKGSIYIYTAFLIMTLIGMAILLIRVNINNATTAAINVQISNLSFIAMEGIDYTIFSINKDIQNNMENIILNVGNYFVYDYYYFEILDEIYYRESVYIDLIKNISLNYINIANMQNFTNGNYRYTVHTFFNNTTSMFEIISTATHEYTNHTSSIKAYVILNIDITICHNLTNTFSIHFNSPILARIYKLNELL